MPARSRYAPSTANRRLRRVPAVLVIALGLLSIGAGSASAKTLVVDRDGAQCTQADFDSISAAVAAADPGDTVKVCADTYTEVVVVDKPGLRLTGPGHLAQGCFDAALPAPNPAREAIVSSPGGRAFDLQADDVLLAGFVLQGSVQGVRTGEAFSGHTVRDNLFQRNTLGATFGGSGARQSRLSHNCFRNNGSGLVGAGVFSAANFGAALENGRMDHNDFFQNNFAIRLGGAAELRVDHNTSLLDGVFIRPAFSGPLTITANRVGEGSGPGISFFLNPAVPQPNTGAVVTHNVVEGRGGHGIAADANALTGSVIAHNVSSDNALDGINLAAGNSANGVEHNRAERNGSDGIHAQGASGNAFLRNLLFDNVEHDAHDDNRPANDWTGNHCETDAPPGTICDP